MSSAQAGDSDRQTGGSQDGTLQPGPSIMLRYSASARAVPSTVREGPVPRDSHWSTHCVLRSRPIACFSSPNTTQSMGKGLTLGLLASFSNFTASLQRTEHCHQRFCEDELTVGGIDLKYDLSSRNLNLRVKAEKQVLFWYIFIYCFY